MSHLPDMSDNLHTLSVAFTTVTNISLDVLLRLASNLVTLDLESNEMESALHSPACERLWCQNIPLRHLNASHKKITIQSFIGLFWGAGRSHLLTMDAAMPAHPMAQVPIRLLPYLLANRMLE